VGSLARRYWNPMEAHLQSRRSRILGRLMHFCRFLMKPGRPHHSPRWFKVCNTGKGRACLCGTHGLDYLSVRSSAVETAQSGWWSSHTKASFLGNASPRYRAYPLWFSLFSRLKHLTLSTLSPCHPHHASPSLSPLKKSPRKQLRVTRETISSNVAIPDFSDLDAFNIQRLP
jgi:hypothetical protein